MVTHGLACRAGSSDRHHRHQPSSSTLCGYGYDVWLLDYRASIALDAARRQYTADQVAAYDYPAAVEEILRVTNARDVPGGCALLRFDHVGVRVAEWSGERPRSSVFTQIATHIVAPTLSKVKAPLYPQCPRTPWHRHP